MHGHFAFVYVQFILDFVLLALTYAHLGALQYWLGLHLQVQSKRTQIHMLLFFHKDETTTHLTHDMQPSMCYSCVQHQKPAVTGHSNVQHLDQYSRQRHVATFQGHLVCHVSHVPTHAQKGFNLNFDFSRKIKGLLRQDMN